MKVVLLALTLVSVGLPSALAAPGFYPDDHWNHVTNVVSPKVLDDLLDDNLDADKAVLSPAWNLVTKAFVGNNDVAFGDVNLSEAGDLRGPPHNPGSGGWPTIRYFNKETGKDGKAYKQKTSGKVCDELGDIDNMIDYVEEAASTVLCDPMDGRNCDEKSLQYIQKLKGKSTDELQDMMDRLVSLEKKDMKVDLKIWLKKRQRILKRFMEASNSDGIKEEM